MFKQLSFAEIIPDYKHSHSYLWSENALLQYHLLNLSKTTEEKFIYVWGAGGCGKSHLLQTIATDFSAEKPSIYLPLQMAESITPQCLENLELQNIVAIDDIHLIRHQKEWEEGVFHLFNRIRDKKETLLVISGILPPAQLGLKLPDLVSRLQWGLCWQLREPSDEQKTSILIEVANKKGFELPISVAQYLLSHYERNLSSLMKIIDDLDIGSLEAKRRIISIPFVKKCLEN